jgi:hypothetical protein
MRELPPSNVSAVELPRKHMNRRPATKEEGNIKVNRRAMNGIFLLRPSRTITDRQINAIGIREAKPSAKYR